MELRADRILIVLFIVEMLVISIKGGTIRIRTGNLLCILYPINCMRGDLLLNQNRITFTCNCIVPVPVCREIHFIWKVKEANERDSDYWVKAIINRVVGCRSCLIFRSKGH